jgi:hypothetical protein
MTEQDLPENAAPEQSPACPKCAGQMWDNRAAKRNPKAPDYKCKTDGCDGVIWPPREAGAVSTAKPAGTPDDPACPVCGGKMWDDRLSKRNPRAPDFKCRNKPRAQGAPGCEGVIWPPRDGERRPSANAAGAAPRGSPAAPRTAPQTGARKAPPPPSSGSERQFSDDEVPDFGAEDDDLPF